MLLKVLAYSPWKMKACFLWRRLAPRAGIARTGHFPGEPGNLRLEIYADFFRRGNNRGSGLTVLVDELIVTYALLMRI